MLIRAGETNSIKLKPFMTNISEHQLKQNKYDKMKT